MIYRFVNGKLESLSVASHTHYRGRSINGESPIRRYEDRVSFGDVSESPGTFRVCVRWRCIPRTGSPRWDPLNIDIRYSTAFQVSRLTGLTHC